MILKMHVYSRIAIAIMIGFLTGSIVFMAFYTTPPYEYDENASFVVPSPANDGDQVTVKWRLKKVNRECPGIAQRVLFDPKTKIILANYDPTPAATSESVRDGYLNRTFALPRALPSGQIAYRALLRLQSASAVRQAVVRADAEPDFRGSIDRDCRPSRGIGGR